MQATLSQLKNGVIRTNPGTSGSQNDSRRVEKVYAYVSCISVVGVKGVAAALGSDKEHPFPLLTSLANIFTLARSDPTAQSNALSIVLGKSENDAPEAQASCRAQPPSLVALGRFLVLESQVRADSPDHRPH